MELKFDLCGLKRYEYCKDILVLIVYLNKSKNQGYILFKSDSDNFMFEVDF